MDRLEFSGETPIPVIKGTNYEKAFADRDAVQRRIEEVKAAGPTDLSGPYSVLFDWKQEQADLKAQKEKAQLTQQKIMRTNALGEAFRVLGEGISARGGAPVTPRNPNPFILNAVNEYAKSDMDYINKLEGVKTKKLALAQTDVQYNLAQNAAGVAKAEKQAERSHEEAKQAEKELDNFIRELRLQENQFRLRGKEAEANGVRDQIKLAEETAAQIAVARKKEQFARGMDLTSEGVTSNINVHTKPEKGDKTAMEFVVPDTQETIYLPQGLVNHIRTYLQHGKGQYDQTVPAVLRDAMKNQAIKPEALYTAISDSWDYIKNSILPPDVYAQIYGGEPGQETVATAPVTDTAVVSAAKNPSGSPASVQELQQTIFTNLTSDTAFDLKNDKSVKKKISEISDLIYANYLLQKDNKKNKNDAVTDANKIVSRYRQLSK
jgi:hypothetical protein